jgi:hypothetical protein
MAYIICPKAPIDGDVPNSLAYEYEVNLTEIGYSEWILFPSTIKYISVTVSPSYGCACKVQTTTDTYATIKTGTNITAVDWNKGKSYSTFSDVCDPVSGIRLYQEHAGTSTMSVRAQ